MSTLLFTQKLFVSSKVTLLIQPAKLVAIQYGEMNFRDPLSAIRSRLP